MSIVTITVQVKEVVKKAILVENLQSHNIFIPLSEIQSENKVFEVGNFEEIEILESFAIEKGFV